MKEKEYSSSGIRNRRKKELNLALKVLSIFVAALIWFIVYNLSDSIVTNKQSVSLNILNQEALDEANLTYTLSNTSQISVEYKIRSRDASKVRKDDFNVYVDLTDLSVMGALPVCVDVKEGKSDFITDLQVEPSVIKITTESIEEHTYELEVETDGEPKENYIISNIAIDNPLVSVRGPKSQLGRIAKAQIRVDVDRISADTTGRAEIVYLDSGDGEVKFDSINKLKSSLDSVNYSVEMLKQKDVELNIQIVGKPADGMIYTSFNLYPTKLGIIGKPDIVDSVDAIDLGILDITDRNEAYTAKIDVQDRLPKGVEIVSTNTIATIGVNIAKIEIEIPSTESSGEDLSTEETLGWTLEETESTSEEESEGTSDSIEETTVEPIGIESSSSNTEETLPVESTVENEFIATQSPGGN